MVAELVAAEARVGPVRAVSVSVIGLGIFSLEELPVFLEKNW